jgi:type IV fimbrial biogenesis protein FimT
MLAVTAQPRRPGQAGVTLAETAIVLAIVSILAVASLPSVVDRWQRETVILLAEQFASSVSVARATAQYRHVQAHLQPLDPSGDWAKGWQLTTSRPANTPDITATPGPGQESLIVATVLPPAVPTVRIRFRIPGNTLSYAPVGYSRNSNGGALHGTLTISSGRHVRQVRINSVGRARVCDPATDLHTCAATGDDP